MRPPPTPSSLCQKPQTNPPKFKRNKSCETLLGTAPFSMACDFSFKEYIPSYHRSVTAAWEETLIRPYVATKNGVMDAFCFPLGSRGWTLKSSLPVCYFLQYGWCFFLKSYTSSTWRWTMKPSSLLFLRYFLLCEQWSEALVWILGFLSQSQNNFKRASCGGLPNHQVTESFLDWLEIHRYFLLPFGFLDGIHIYIFSARNLVLALNGFKAPLLILYIPSHLVPVENISL